MNLDEAIKSHGDWRLKMRIAISEKQPLDAEVLGADKRCPLGLWLNGEARGQYANLPGYQTCVAEHAAFHKCAGEVARVANAGQYSEATAMMGPNTPYMKAAFATVKSIAALKAALRKATSH